MRKFIGRHKIAVVITGAVALLGVYPGISTGSTEPSEQVMYTAMQDAQSRVDAINDTDDIPDVVQNLVPGAIEKRDTAIKAFEAADDPDPASKPEYAVVWAGKNNAGDISGNYAMRFLNQGSINPQGLADVGRPQFLPGLDAMVVSTCASSTSTAATTPTTARSSTSSSSRCRWASRARRTTCSTSGRTASPIIAGAPVHRPDQRVGRLRASPNIKLLNVIRPEENPQGSIPDAYDLNGDGRAIGTYMGGPNVPPNFGGSPGAIVVFKPDPEKGLVLESETPGRQVRRRPAAATRAACPSPARCEEARPLGTCANPHGIQIRHDLGIMVTADYAEPARSCSTR